MNSEENHAPLVSQFSPISLAEMECLFLMNRVDLKFIMPIDKLQPFLNQIMGDYQILQINGERIFRYSTNYFDTTDLKLYMDHQNGRLNRFKIRARTYEINKLSFFEIKKKTNKGKTVKARIRVDETEKINEEQLKFIQSELPGFNSKLEFVSQNHFNRITLASFNSRERVTIDYNISFSQNGTIKPFHSILVVEIKKEQFSTQSPILSVLRSMNVQSKNFSKYCMGMAMLNNQLKQNSFKPNLLYINKLGHVNNAS